MIGRDENYNQEASPEEKTERVLAILDAVKDLNLTVKGNLDNAEPVFAVGSLSGRKTHYFENVVTVEEDKLVLSADLKYKLEKCFSEPKVSPVSNALYMPTESNAASPKKEFGFINGCA